jgi:nicotinamide phosphoribosyltransferase
MKKNIILSGDSYKHGNFDQYPPGTEYAFSYIKSQGGDWDKTVFFGLQGFLKEYLANPITKDQIDEADSIIKSHGQTFNRAIWDYIIQIHQGRLPIRIRAVPEGSVVPTNNVLVSIENTDPNCFWLPNFLETALLRAVWYPTTAATNSYETRKIILSALEKTGDPSLIDFKLHDFGACGSSSYETAGIGGAAHLVSFMATDNISGLLHAREFYGANIAGFSMPAAGVSTITCWGEKGEFDSYKNMIQRHSYLKSTLAITIDSYDPYAACKKIGEEFKKNLIDSHSGLVVRLVAGEPTEVIPECLDILEKYFGSVKNKKGYRILNYITLMYGDDISIDSITNVLEILESRGFSANNISFGQGGILLQRHTLKFVSRLSSVGIRDNTGYFEWHDVVRGSSNNDTGRMWLYKRSDGTYYSQKEDWVDDADGLHIVFEEGQLKNEISFDHVRHNSRII